MFQNKLENSMQMVMATMEMMVTTSITLYIRIERQMSAKKEHRKYLFQCLLLTVRANLAALAIISKIGHYSRVDFLSKRQHLFVHNS